MGIRQGIAIQLLLVVVFVATICRPAFAGNSGITYHARIIRPDEIPLEGKEVQFRLQIRTPGAENCLLFEETQTHDLRNSGGVVAITINDGSGVRTDGGSYNFDQIFANRVAFTFPSSKCSSGNGSTTWTPNDADGRKFHVLFREDSSRQWEPLPATQMNFVPMAIESKQIGGYTASNLLRVADGSGPQAAPVLSPTQATELVTLTNGASTLYTKAGQLNGVAIPTSYSANESIRWNGTTWVTYTTLAAADVQAFAKAALPICAAGEILTSDGTTLGCVTDGAGAIGDATTSTKGLVAINATGGIAVSGGTISLASSGVAAGTYTKVSVDAMGRVLTGATLVANDIPSLDAAKITTGTFTASQIPGLDASKITSGTFTTPGMVSGDAITSGTIGGSTALVTTGAVSASSVSSKSIYVWDSDNTNNVQIVTPATATLSTNYVLTLPSDDGTAGQVLSTDGTGALSWVTGNSGSVTSVAVSMPAIFSVTGGPITSSGTIAATLATQAANTVFAAPDGSSGTPTFRSLASSDIPALDAAKIATGTFTASQIPALDASKITTGTFAQSLIPALSAAQIPALDASKITTGTFATALIPDLDAAKIATGTLNAARIPDLDAAKIATGTLAVGRIPDLDAAKTTTGTFAVARIPALDASNVPTGTFAASQIPSLDASKIGTGTFTASQIPDLDAAKITTGTLSVPVNTTGMVGSRSLQVFDSDSTNKVTIQTPATGSLTADYTLTLPVDDGANGQVLTTDGAGALTWSSAAIGSVTSVDVNLPNIFSLTGGPITSAGTISATLASQAANSFWAAPNGAPGAPTFRAMVAADVPALDAGKITTGTFTAAQIPDLDSAKIATGTLNAARIPDLDSAKIATGTLNAARIPDLDSAKIATGTLNAARIPDLDAGKITTGTFNVAQIPDLDAAKTTTGTFAVGRIPDLDAAKIATGTLSVARIPDLDAAKTTTGTFAVARIPALDASNVPTGTFAASQIPDLDAAKITTGTLTVPVNTTGMVGSRSIQVFDSDSTNKVTIVTPATGSLTTDYQLTLPVDDGTNGQVLTTNGSGALTWSSAAIGSVTSVDVNLPNIFSMTGGPITAAGTISATLASQAANSFWAAPNGAPGAPTFRAMVAADIPALDAAKIATGTFTAAQIPDLDAAKIATGTLNVARIPDLDAAKIATGTLNVARIPDLDAAKIATGTLNVARIPDLDAAKIATGTLNVARIPDLDAAKTTTGTFAVARIPDLDAAKITSGTIDPARLPTSANLWSTDGTNVYRTSGNVGIGTTSPTNFLDVTNNANSVTTIGVNNSSNTGSAGSQLSLVSTGGTLQLQTASSAGGGASTLMYNGSQLRTVANNASGYLSYSTGGSAAANERMRIDSNGRVGIGTTAPGYLLHVEGPGYITGDIGTNTFWMNPSQATLNSSSGLRLNIDSDNNETGLAFAIGTNSTNQHYQPAGELFRVQDDGKVGIGTSVPNRSVQIGTGSSIVQVGGANGMLLSTDPNGVASFGSNAYVDQSNNTRTASTNAGGFGYALINSGWGAINFYTGSGNTTADASITPNQRMVITSAGNVGVGNGSPGTKLDVGGVITASPQGTLANQAGEMRFAELAANGANYAALRVPDALAANYTLTLPVDDGSPNQVLQTDGNGVLTWTAMTSTGSGTYRADNGTAAVPTFSFAADTNTGMYSIVDDVLGFSTGGTNRLAIAANGNVGIGTTAPGQALSVNGNVSAYNFYSTTGTAAAVNFGGSGAGMYIPATNVLGFSTNGSARLTIDASGQLGVGTTAPGSPLEVNGRIKASNLLLSDSNSAFNISQVPGGGSGLYLTSSAVTQGAIAGGARYVGGTGWYASGGTSASFIELSSGATTFYGNTGLTNGNIYTPTARMTLDSTGNLGVGTTAPGTKLDVAGAITANAQGTNANQGGEMRFRELAANGANYAALRVPDALAADYTLTLPADDGSPNQVLQTDGNGVLTWVAMTSTGSGTYRADNGTAAIPTFSFAADTNSGMYSIVDDVLGFSTGGTNRMAINASGNVGIGTTAPVARFDVNGTARVTGVTAMGSSGAGVEIQYASNTGSVFAYDRSTSTYKDIVVQGLTAKLSNGAGNGVFVDSVGKVGVGTTSPGTQLDVVGVITANAQGTNANQGGEMRFRELAANGANYAALRVPDALAADYTLTLPADDGSPNQVLQTDGNGVLTWVAMTSTGSGTYRADNGTAAIPTFSFTADTNSGMYSIVDDVLGFSTNSTNRLTIDSSGNVGIGTTAPSNLLEVRSNSAGITTPLALTNGATATGSGASLIFKAGTVTMASIGNVVEGSTSDASLTFSTRKTGGNPSERVRIDSSGNVGIGTTNPGQPLDVVGIARAGRFFANGAINNPALPQLTFNSDSDTGLYLVGNDMMGISTGATERMRFSATGDIGIGTTAPGTTLDVKGVITANVQGTAAGQGGEMRFQELAANGANYAALRVPDALAANYTLTLPVDDGSPNQVLQTDGNGVLTWTAMTSTGSGTYLADNGTAAIPTFSFTGDTNTGMYNVAADTLGFSTNNTNRLTIGATGNVGIGTTAPSTPLHVNGTIKAVVVEGVTSGSNNILFENNQFDANGLRLMAQDSLNFLIDNDNNGTGTVNIRKGSTNSATGTSLLLINNAGSVGIGTTTPVTKLDVSGNMRASAVGGGSAAGIQSYSGSPAIALGNSAGAADEKWWDIWANGKSLYFRTVDDANSTSNTYMQVSRSAGATLGAVSFPASNVGIGTTAPSTLLDVKGIITANVQGTNANQGGEMRFQELAANGANYAALRVPDALAANYTLTLPVDDGTANQVLQTDGNGVLTWATVSAGSSGTFRADDGTAAVPTHSFTNDTNTGMYSVAADTLGFSTNNTNRLTISATGYVGIGTTAPLGQLQALPSGETSVTNSASAGYQNNYFFGGISGSSMTHSAINLQGNTGAIYNAWSARNTVGSMGGLNWAYQPRSSTNDITARVAAISAFNTTTDSTSGGDIVFLNRPAGGANMLERARIDQNGNVGIGTTAPASKLDVAGIITANVQGTNANQGGEMRFQELVANGANYAALRVPDALAANYTLTLPVDDGTANQYLQTDGNGVLTWATVSAGSSGTFRADDGTAAIPTHSFTNDTNTGMYSVAADTLGFSTNNTNRLTIDSTGNVGIGTTAPTERLSLGSYSTNADTFMTMRTAGSGASKKTGIKLRALDDGYGFDIFHDDGSSPTGLNIIRHESNATGNSALFITRSSGNVGLGTTAPSSDLSFGSGGSGRRVAIETSGAGAVGTYFTLAAGHAGTGTNLNGGDLTLAAGGSRGSAGSGVYFQTASAGGSGTGFNTPTTKMVLSSNGDLGIGTTAPTGRLDVVVNPSARFVSLATTASSGAQSIFNASNNTVTTPIVIQNLDNTASIVHGQHLKFQMSYTSGAFAAVDSGQISNMKEQEWTSTASTQDSGLRFSTTLDGTMAEKMRIDSAGNLAIGTTAPAAKLDVNGAVRIANDATACSATNVGAIRFNGTNVQYCVSNTWTTLASGSGSQWITNGSAVGYTGPVGIGTTSPLALELHVADPGGTTSQIKLTNNTGSTASDGIDMQLTNNDFWIQNNEGGRIDFTTTATSRLTILPSGSVGIGTTNPTGGQLVVHDSTVNTGVYPLIVSGDTGAGPGKYVNLVIDNKTSGAYKSGVEFRNNGAGKYSIGVDFTGAGANDFSFYDGVAGATRMLISPTGDVGIGTTGPNSRLQVVGGDIAIDSGKTVSFNGGAPGWRLGKDLSSYTKSLATGSSLDVLLSGNDWEGFTIGGGGSSYYEVSGAPGFSIRHFFNGNVGIGTSAPTGKLSVYDNVAGNVQMDLKNASTNGAAYATLNTQSGNYYNEWRAYSSGFSQIQTNATMFDIKNNVGYIVMQTAATERLRIDTNGNVGIGTTAPTAKLHVAGAIASNETTVSVAAGATHPGSGGVDMSAGNVFTFSTGVAGACPTIKLDFNTMVTGGAYTVVLSGYNSGTCTFANQTGATTAFKYYGGAAPTLSGTGDVVCTMTRANSKVYTSCLIF